MRSREFCLIHRGTDDHLASARLAKPPSTRSELICIPVGRKRNNKTELWPWLWHCQCHCLNQHWVFYTHDFRDCRRPNLHPGCTTRAIRSYEMSTLPRSIKSCLQIGLVTPSLVQQMAWATPICRRPHNFSDCWVQSLHRSSFSWLGDDWSKYNSK